MEGLRGDYEVIKREISILLSVVLVISGISIYGCTPEEATESTSKAYGNHRVSSPKDDTLLSDDPMTTTSPTPDPQEEINKKKDAFKRKSVSGIKTKKRTIKKVALKWNKVTDATGYKVYRSTKKKGSYRCLATVTKAAYTDKKAKQRKTYFYKVRAITKINNFTVESGDSKSLKVYVQPINPKTVIIGECFAVALEKERSRMPSYFRYVGRAGMSTYTMLSNNEFSYNGRSVTAFEKAATYKPDRIIFFVGANYSGSINPTKSANLFVKMKKLMSKINPHVQFVVMAVSPWKKDSKYGRLLPSHAKRHLISNAYKKVAKSHKDIYYCGLTAKMEGSNGDLLSQFNGGDGLHWSNYARQWMVKNLRNWCKKYLGTW